MAPSAVGFIVIVGIFIVLAVLAIRTWGKTQPLTGLPVWRKLAFGLGTLALATQVVIFAFIWTRVGEDQVLFPRWMRLIFPLFWISVVGIGAGKGPARWALLAISVFVLVLSFFTLLSV